jgi:hypothetical protein
MRSVLARREQVYGDSPRTAQISIKFEVNRGPSWSCYVGHKIKARIRHTGLSRPEADRPRVPVFCGSGFGSRSAVRDFPPRRAENW